MLRELAQLDPERAAKLHARDKKRVVRAYEDVYKRQVPGRAKPLVSQAES